MDPFAKKMWAAGLGSAFFLLLLFASLTLVYMHQRPKCPDRVVGQTESPDRKWAAAILERRCGSDAPFVTRVNIRPAGLLQVGFLSGQALEGNVFVIEQDAASLAIRLDWTADNQLRVICPRCSSRYIQQEATSWGPVEISYQRPH